MNDYAWVVFRLRLYGYSEYGTASARPLGFGCISSHSPQARVGIGEFRGFHSCLFQHG